MAVWVAMAAHVERWREHESRTEVVGVGEEQHDQGVYWATGNLMGKDASWNWGYLCFRTSPTTARNASKGRQRTRSVTAMGGIGIMQGAEEVAPDHAVLS